MTHRFGIDGKIYSQTDGHQGGAGWNEIAGVEDVSLGLEDEEADLTTRDMPGFRAVVQGLRSWDVEFTIVWDPSEATFESLRAAYFGRTRIGLRVLDGEVGTSGSQGPQADYVITRFSRGEQRGDVMVANVMAKLTRSDDPPEWFEAP